MKTAAAPPVATSYGSMSFEQLDAKLHAQLDKAEDNFAEAVKIARMIRDRTLWRPDFRTFDAYLVSVAEKRQMRKSHKYELVNQLRVCIEILDGAADFESAMADLPNERQSRKLGTLPDPESRRQAYGGAKRAAAAEGSPVQQRHVDASVDRLRDTTKIADPAERKKVQQQLMDELAEQQSGHAQHRTQRSRLDKFAGHAEQQGRLLRAATSAEMLAMLKVGLQTYQQADLKKLDWHPQELNKFKMRLAAVIALFEE